MKRIKFFPIVLLSLLLFSCNEDYLQTEPTNLVEDDFLFETIDGFEAAINGIHRYTYTYHDAHDRFGQKAMDYAFDCISDDFYPTERGYGWFVGWYQHLEHRIESSGGTAYVWSYYYKLVNSANLIIKNLEAKEYLLASEQYKQSNFLAQAYTYRAFAFYNLVQLYGEDGLGVPIPTEPNSEGLARATIDDVYKQIFDDLEEAVRLFEDEGGSNIKRPNVSHINEFVTKAILARVNLTRGEWGKAADYAEEVIAAHNLTSDYTYGWNEVTSEWVWGAVLIDEQQTSYASFFSHMDPFFGGYGTLGNHHIMPEAVFNFLDDNDMRKVVNQPDVYYPQYYGAYFGSKPRSSFKYTGMGEWTNDYLYIKSGEMYLIAAEAYQRDNKDGDALIVLNALNLKRAKNPSAYTPVATTGDALLADILMYRRAELWGDGQRLFDMKRLNIGNVYDNVNGRNPDEQPMSTLSINTYAPGDHRFNFLIPKQEMDSNPLMVQNNVSN